MLMLLTTGKCMYMYTYCISMCFINKLTQVMYFINIQASQRHEPSDTEIKIANSFVFERMQSGLVYFSFVNF